MVLTDIGDVYSFGRGLEGQLGHGPNDDNNHCHYNNNGRIESSEAKLVSSLSDEMIVSIAAGSLTSYAVTLAGDVYHWGLIHRGDKSRFTNNNNNNNNDDDDNNDNAVQSGQLTGIAGNQDEFVVEVDIESRAMQQQTMNNNSNSSSTNTTASSNSTGSRSSSNSGGGRYLRDIVSDSIERWQLPTDHADREYHQELLAMGYQNEGSRDDDLNDYDDDDNN